MSEALAVITHETLAGIENPFEFMIGRYQRDPLAFVAEVLGAEPYLWQRKALIALGQGHTRISIRSGHGVGKTAFLSWVLLWHTLTRFPQKAICTAPSAPQLYDALWAELRTWVSRLPRAWQELLDPTSDRIMLRARREESFISARTSRAETPEALAGVHSRFVLLIVDEASGVPEQVFEAATGSMSTPGAITVLTGNPTRSSGFFHQTHTREADRWWTLRVSSEECAHVDRLFIEDVVVRYGRNSNAYRVRIMGEFPLAQGDTLIGAEIVEDAMRRPMVIDQNEPEIWGVDPARFGVDSSVLIKRRDKVVIEQPRSWQGIDTMALTGQIVNEWQRTAPINRPRLIVVDGIGIGSGVVDRMRELKMPYHEANVSEASSVDGQYWKLRDELWQRCADWLMTRLVSMPYHERLRDDLVAPRYSFRSDGRLVVESKAQMKQRRLPSPDYADALCLTFINPALTAGSLGQLSWATPLRRNIRGLV